MGSLPEVSQLVELYFSKAGRGRPEGPTERSVFKIIFVMLAVLQLRIRQIYKVENVT